MNGLPSHLHALGFSWRKRSLLRDFLPGHRITFVRDARRVPGHATLLVWGATPRDAALADTVALVRVEDGFLRSVGLGAELVRPLSWVFDRTGLYLDASRASDLESLLQSRDFDAAVLARARELRQRIVGAGLTKYGVGAGRWQRPTDRPVVLVVGQVESDASLKLGAPGIATNHELLRAARALHPGAYLLYKPHPDVVAGLRAAGAGESAARQECDEVVSGIGLDELLKSVDAVHVLTSLAGFEALLRGVPVTCHGLPFYAGWGLTQDRLACARRTRRLSLDALVAGALLEYPSYVSRADRARCSPEQVIRDLADWKARSAATLSAGRRAWRGVLRLTVGVA